MSWFNKKSYSIVISGGASKASYSVGVLNAIREKNLNITSVIGSSAGGLNGALFATDEIEKLTRHWCKINPNNSWYKSWTFGIAEGIFRGSLYDFSPIESWIDILLNVNKLRNSKIKFACVAINIHTGEKRVFTNKDSNIKSGLKATIAHQFASKPVMIDNELYTDGGISTYIPLDTALEIDPYADYYIVVSNTKISVNEKRSIFSNIIHRFKRVHELSSYFSDMKELDLMKLKLGQKLIYIEPEEQIVSTMELDNKKIRQFIEQGYHITMNMKF